MPHLLPATLLIIDVQKAIDDPLWVSHGPRANPEAETRIAALLAHWRAHRWPVVHLRHSSQLAGSPYSAKSAGFAFKYAVNSGPLERVVTKRNNNGFINTALHAELKQLHCQQLVVCGVTTNHSVDATVRHAAGLGYRVTLATDATAAIALVTPEGEVIDADTVQRVFLANLAGEYCALTLSDDIIGAHQSIC
ncbi:isochorismatase family protein [Simiduia sp. 21SJ11W-1]|uniref:isochorismatase family protein n=1 Tax=Simiduia sp. 21SJ11W-1 TaxID=2909669 RepID=UPI0020A10F36|nr:isochorismatase family protein [Simiduia sp. 21SJ11W-1]UTA48212.1 isochorismatase family protein [Simiduia sp. 21SJ11W-1]